jgi:hypothetical protein
VEEKRGCVLLEKLIERARMGFVSHDPVAYFIVLAALQALLSIVAWGTSSGYEDSAIPYLLQAILGLLQLAVLCGIVWRQRT